LFDDGPWKEEKKSVGAFEDSFFFLFFTSLHATCRDYNPLHIDPKIAPRVGFKKPILHGLCTYGHAAHAAVKTFGHSNSNALKSITGRFTAPVYPGDTLATKMWKVPADAKDQEKIIFQVVAKERDQVVINGGCVVLWTNKGPQSKL
jgi:acyl dehydratase